MESKEFDNVQKAKHYNLHPSGVECIDVVEHLDFCIGNAIKYMWRSGLKVSGNLSDIESEIQDLKKSIYYINRKIKLLENGQSSKG